MVSQLEIVGIAVNSPSEDLAAAIERHGIEWPRIAGDEANQLAKTFGINSYPTTFLIAPEGVIVRKDLIAQIHTQEILDIIGE